MTTRSRGAFLLAQVGSTQEAIASKLDVDDSLISLWQTGRRNPSLPNRRQLLTHFGIPIEAWDEPVAPPPPPPPPAPAEGAAPASSWGESSVRARIETLERAVDADVTRVGKDHSMTPLERAKVMGSLAHTLGTLRRLKGEDVAEVRVTRHPKWIALKNEFLRALEGHPDALAAVVEVLTDAERRQD